MQEQKRLLISPLPPDVDWLMCQKQRTPHRLMEMKTINLPRAEFKDTSNIEIKVKKI